MSESLGERVKAFEATLSDALKKDPPKITWIPLDEKGFQAWFIDHFGVSEAALLAQAEEDQGEVFLVQFIVNAAWKAGLIQPS